jgi:hypothetical protein
MSLVLSSEYPKKIIKDYFERYKLSDSRKRP